jgi:hypothetical protein
VHDRRIAAALFVLALGPYVYFYGGWGANQEVNYALTRAIVEAHKLHIDDFTGREGDIAAGAGGHIFINKPPGLSALAVPSYYAQFRAQQRGWFTLSDYWVMNKRLITIQICGVGGALIAPILYLYGRRRLGVSAWSAALVAICIAFGTIVFAYSTMFFAHVPSALFLLLAFVLLRDRPFFAGLAAGIAGACFFLSAIAAVILALLAWSYCSWRKAALFVAGGIPVAAALAVYQWICFGSPFTTPVERSISFTDERLFLGVFGRPRLESLWGLTFSEYRGLFICSPVLLFAFAGAVVMIRRRRFLPELAAIAAIVALFFAVNSSFNGWHGGAAFGPRYLLPIVPLMAIPMMFVADRARWLWLAAGAVSIAINLAATAVDPMTLDGITRPITGYVLPNLVAHRVSPEARALLYPECKTLRCAPKKVSLTPDARNLGERWLGEGRATSLLPAMIWIIAGSGLLLSAVSRGTAGLVGGQ